MKQNRRTKSWFDIFFPLAIGLTVYISVLIWLKLDSNLPHWDMGRHLYLTTVYKSLWLRVPQSIFHLGSILLNYYYYPPIVHNLGLLFESLFGFKTDSAVASNIIWILMLSFSVYALAKELYGRWAAVASILFTFASPIMIGQFREFQVDMPLTAIFSLSLYLLFKTKNFVDTKYSIWIGIIGGLGMMTKWTFSLFIVPAGLLFLLLGLTDKKVQRRIVLKNAALTILCGLLVCGGWYVRSRYQLQIDFSQNGIKTAAIEGDPYGFNVPAFTWYLKRLATNYLLLPLSLIFLLGAISSLIRKEWKLLFLLVLYYLMISTLPNKDVRYIMPTIGIIAISGSSFVKFMSGKALRIVFSGLLVLIFISNNALIAFGSYLPLKKTSSYVLNPTYGILFSENGYTSNSPKREVCPMDQIIYVIPAGAKARLIGQSNIDFSDWAVAYYLSKENRVWTGQSDDLSKTDYFIYRNSDNLSESQSKSIKESKLIESFNCIDGSVVSVYKSK